MAVSEEELISTIQADLERFIKPREQVNYMRRILTLHLETYAEGPAVPPLALNDCKRLCDVGNELKGVYREYVEALQANSAARRDFEAELDAARHDYDDDSRTESISHDSDLLDSHLALMKLRQKQDCLSTIQRALKRLSEKAAFMQDLLDSEQVKQAAPALPEVPRSVVDDIAAEQSTIQPDLPSRIHQVDKALLRARLLLKKEKRLLSESRARLRDSNEPFGNDAKLEALSATRGELIAWIEAELSKASAQDPEGLTVDSERRRQPANRQTVITAQLKAISQKYATYVAARREVLELACTRWQPSMSPPQQRTAQSTQLDVHPTPVDHLLTPHVEALLSIARQQKSMVAHKSHSSSTMNKQTKAVCQALDRLAEESQLLPSHPMKGPLPQIAGVSNDVFGSSGQPQVATRAMPWVVAADSAKISTLEAVAEAIEGGQVALEGCMRSLQDIDHLLSRGLQDKKHSDTEISRQQAVDPWSFLHGNLDSIDGEPKA
ncbi:hypothetical protein L249_5771 [Ophiocordyceps polyrhachis-furcata BCC 54312]|uniref:Uncharacterized protein n=1 Tax=Ophiocordyceps polyrhachis-furcata BCC 54312 TaxID=1330021 RepID=A0A367L079_9HYPO|nr:hypothetical protein L249_5771 [Ophiocordyceps polyrhachis-furcata BCC 54312]